MLTECQQKEYVKKHILEEEDALSNIINQLFRIASGIPESGNVNDILLFIDVVYKFIVIVHHKTSIEAPTTFK